MANLVRDIPSVLYGTQEDYRRLFYSSPDIALTIQVTISGGFGILPAGTLLSKNDSAAGGLGKYIPYDPHASITGAEFAPCRAYLLQDGAASTSIYISIDDSYKFVVADDLLGWDDNTGPTAIGAIASIDRTTYPNYALVVGTGNVGTDIDLSDFGYVSTEGSDTADGVLMNSVDTGVGVNAQGAIANMIISNAVLYRAALRNYDAGVLTDLTASLTGQYIIIK